MIIIIAVLIFNSHALNAVDAISGNIPSMATTESLPVIANNIPKIQTSESNQDGKKIAVLQESTDAVKAIEKQVVELKPVEDSKVQKCVDNCVVTKPITKPKPVVKPKIIHQKPKAAPPTIKPKIIYLKPLPPVVVQKEIEYYDVSVPNPTRKAVFDIDCISCKARRDIVDRDTDMYIYEREKELRHITSKPNVDYYPNIVEEEESEKIVKKVVNVAPRMNCTDETCDFTKPEKRQYSNDIKQQKNTETIDMSILKQYIDEAVEGRVNKIPKSNTNSHDDKKKNGSTVIIENIFYDNNGERKVMEQQKTVAEPKDIVPNKTSSNGGSVDRKFTLVGERRYADNRDYYQIESEKFAQEYAFIDDNGEDSY